MNAISTLSRCSYLDSGDAGLPLSHRSGYGSSQIGSLTASSIAAPTAPAGPKSAGNSRRERCLVMSSVVFVAMA